MPLAVAAMPLALCSGFAVAQNELPSTTAAASTLEPVIVTGSKSDGEFGTRSGIPLSRMPQSVQVIDAEEIVASGIQSFGDVLRSVPSGNVGNSRVARYQSFSLKVRGFLADQMRNGMRQRYYEDIDASALSNVERVEVLKGPSSVLYGQSALGGILSIVTKRPQPVFGASGALTFGSHGQRMASVDVTGALTDDGRLTARLTGEVERSDTFVDFQDMNRDNLGLALDWVLSPGVKAHLVTEYIERRTLGNPGLPVQGTVRPNGVADIPLGRYLGEPSLQPLTAQAPLLQSWVDIDLGGGWTLTPRYQYQEFASAFSQVRVRAIQADGVTLNRNGRFGAEDDTFQIGQLDLQGRLSTGTVQHKLLFGTELSREKGTFHQDNLSNVGAISVLDPVYTYPSVAPATVFPFDFLGDGRGRAFYAQDVISIAPTWDVITGLRHSRFDYRQNTNGAVDDSRSSATTWQLATNFKLDAAWSLYGGVNTGFDIENTFASRSANGRAFKPERSDQGEAGLRYGAGRARASAAVFQIRRTDVITADPNDPDFSLQSGEQRVRGFEVEGEFDLTRDWTAAGGYAWLRGKVTRSNDGDEGAELGDTPRHTSTARTAYAIPGTGFTVRAGVSAVGSRRLVNGSDVVLPRYALLDLGVGYAVGKLTLNLTANNATDKRYFTATGNSFAVYPGDPRQISLRAGYRF